MYISMLGLKFLSFNIIKKQFFESFMSDPIQRLIFIRNMCLMVNKPLNIVLCRYIEWFAV